MHTISFSGIDGAGKTAQIRRLTKYLEMRDKRVCVLNTIAFSIGNAYKKIDRKREQTERSGKAQSISRDGAVQIFLRRAALAIDIVRFWFFAHRAKQRCDFLLLDRYFYDTIINIHYLAFRRKTGGCPTMPQKSFFERFIVRPDTAFYFSVSGETAARRLGKDGQDRAYLECKQMMFLSRTSGWKMRVINAEQSEEAIFKEVVRQEM